MATYTHSRVAAALD